VLTVVQVRCECGCTFYQDDPAVVSSVSSFVARCPNCASKAQVVVTAIGRRGPISTETIAVGRRLVESIEAAKAEERAAL